MCGVFRVVPLCSCRNSGAATLFPMPEQQSRRPFSTRTFLGLGPLEFQGLLLACAICVFALFWSISAHPNVLTTLVFTFIDGNLTVLGLTLVAPLFVYRRFPWNWLLFALVLVPLCLVSSAVADTIAAGIARHPYRLSPLSMADIKLGTFVGLTFGMLTFAFRDTKTRLEGKLQAQVEIGQVERAQREAELQSAFEIQSHLLPRQTPQIKGFEISCAWQPARTVSGDYFDVLQLSGDTLGICIADVSGKGIPASLLMANLQASVKAFAEVNASPADICQRLNQVLCASVAPGKFVTLVYGTLSVATRRFEYENAGHCAPLLLRADGSEVVLDDGSGVLGLFSEWRFTDRSLQLASGDVLILVTDGVLEAADAQEEEFGYARLSACVRRYARTGAHNIRAQIMDEVGAFCSNHFHDDASLIVIVAQ